MDHIILHDETANMSSDIVMTTIASRKSPHDEECNGNHTNNIVTLIIRTLVCVPMVFPTEHFGAKYFRPLIAAI